MKRKFDFLRENWIIGDNFPAFYRCVLCRIDCRIGDRGGEFEDFEQKKRAGAGWDAHVHFANATDTGGHWLLAKKTVLAATSGTADCRGESDAARDREREPAGWQSRSRMSSRQARTLPVGGGERGSTQRESHRERGSELAIPLHLPAVNNGAGAAYW